MGKWFYFIIALFTFLLDQTLWAKKIIVYGEKNKEKSPPGVSSQTIEVREHAQRFQKISEVLKAHGLVHIEESYGLTSKEAGVSIRGFRGKHIKVIVDGHPLLEGNFDDIPLQTIARIEVSRGSLGSIYGDKAMGGVIHITTKKKEKTSHIGVKIGSFGKKELSLEGHQQYKDHSLFLSSIYDLFNGNFPIDNDAHPDLEKVVLKNNDTQKVYAGMSYNHEGMGISSEGSLFYQERGINGLSGNFFKKVREATWKEKFRTNAPTYQGIPSLDLDLSFSFEANHHHFRDPLGEIDGFPRSRKDQALLFAAKGDWSVTSMDSLIPNGFILYQDYAYAGPSLKKSRETLSLVQSIESYFFDDSFIITPSLNFTFVSDRNFESAYSLCLEQKITDEWSLVSQWGKSFRYPSFEELYFEEGIAVGNPHLEPEESLGGDLGTKLQGDWISWQMNVFYYKTYHLIHYFLVSGFQYKPFNVSRSVHQGIETNLTIGPFYKTSLNMSLTQQKIFDDDPSSPYYKRIIPQIPWRFGHIGLDFQWNENLSFYSKFFFSQGRFINRSNTQMLDTHFSFDLTSEWIIQKYKVNFGIKNVLDRVNLDVRGIYLPGRSYSMGLMREF